VIRAIKLRKEAVSAGVIAISPAVQKEEEGKKEKGKEQGEKREEKEKIVSLNKIYL
jgi:hypothetical protein